MRFLFISQTGSMLALAQKVADEGHYTLISSNSSCGEGIVNHIPFNNNIRHTINEASCDVVLYDDVKQAYVVDNYNNTGRRIAFSSLWSKVLKDDDYQTNLIKSFDLNLYDNNQLKDIDKLQFTIEGWFNGHQFITSYLAKVYDRLQSNNAGPKVIPQGAVIWGKFKGKLYNQTLGKIEHKLRKVTYRGPVSLDITVTTDNIYVNKIKAEPTRATTTAFLEGTKTNISDILLAISSGSTINNIKIDNWIVSVGLSVPPFPYNSQPFNTTFSKFKKGILKHFWPEDIKCKDNQYQVTGCSGLLGYITARGTSIKEARRRIKRTINALEIKDLQYRCDIGKHDIKDYQLLYKWNWIDYDKSLYVKYRHNVNPKKGGK